MDRDWLKETIKKYKPVIVHLKPFDRWSRCLAVHEWEPTGDIAIQMFGIDTTVESGTWDTDDYSMVGISPDDIDALIAALHEVKARMRKPS